MRNGNGEMISGLCYSRRFGHLKGMHKFWSKVRFRSIHEKFRVVARSDKGNGMSTSCKKISETKKKKEG